VSSVTLQGQGKSTKLINVAACNIISTDVSLTDFRLRDIFFDNSGTDYVFLDFYDASLTTTGLEISGCEFDNVRAYAGAVTNFQFFNNYCHDMTHASTPATGHALQVALNSDGVFVHHNKFKSCTGVAVLVNTGSANTVVDSNILDTVATNTNCFAIDIANTTNVTVKGNTIDGCTSGILSEDSAGIVTITGNNVVGTAATAGAGIKVWRTLTGSSQASKVIVSANNIGTVKSGITIADESDISIISNKLYTLGQYGIQVNCTSGWTAPRYALVALNDIFDFADSTAYGSGVYVGGTAGLDYIDIKDNNIDGNSNTNARGIQCAATTMPNSRITGNTIKGIAAAANKLYAVPSDVLVSRNQGYIGRGEIKTISGTLAGVTPAGIMLSLDNPFGQAVRVLDVDIDITTQGAGSGTMCAGVGSSATTDYATIFSVLPTDPGTTYPYFYRATKTATYGVLSSPINWATGSGNRYLNFYAHAANNGLVATYTVTVMGA
jgi:hypothetical protein